MSGGDTHELPPSFPSSRYAVKKLIGEGSRKRVFLAHDTRLDRAVAVAFIKTEGLDAVALDRVHREAREMGRLGDHPNIVTVYDISEADGQLYIVTQFMAGGDVKRLLDSAGSHRVPIGRAIEITEQVCAALEHAHARGVVHRDVKPDNVWLSESGVAHLGDFGLALGRERTRLTSEGTIVGTFAYMAPEQALGRAPEPRSDLYSVGAMLYEMVAGRPPFVGDDPVVVVSQHINAAPVAPSWHNPEVPSDLEALILQLLAKTANDRPVDAAVVRGALAAIARAPRLQVKQRDHGENPIGRLAGGVFVGRAQEMEDLRADVVQTLARHGRLVLLGGEPGIGKTSIGQEVATYARLAGLQVLWGRCDDTGGAPPYWPWVQVIRSYVHDSSVANTASVMGSGAADIAQVVPEVGRELPPSSARPPVAPDQARFRLFDSIATFLRNAGAHQPLLLIIDDLHAADMPSLLLLQFLTRQIGDMNVMVVASYRDVEVGRQHPLFQVLGELVREPVTRRVTLRGLSEQDVGRYIELSTSTPAPGLATAVFRETEGNPFFIGEVVRLLVTEGRLESAHIGGIWRSELPQGVREAIGRRLDRLSPDCNRVLALGSVVGREFSLNVLERADDAPREALFHVLEEAVAARVVAEVPGAAGRYSFSHSLFRETLYGELTTTKRIHLHRRVGEALETMYRLRPDPHFTELAHHFFEAAQGGDPEKALHYGIRAGDRAAEQMAHEEAARHYEMGLQVLEGTDPNAGIRVVDLLLTLSEAWWRAGKVDKAKDASLRAIDIARNLGASEHFARAALGLAGRLPAFGAVKRDETVIAVLEEALRGLHERDSAVRALAMARLAEEQSLTETHEQRWELARNALEIARRVGDPMVLASVLKSTFFAYWDPLNLDARLGLSDELIRLADQLRDRALGLEGHMFRFLGLVEKPDAVGARRELDICQRAAKELRQPYHEFVVAVLRGCMAYMEGRIGEVEALAQAALLLGQATASDNAALFTGVQFGRLNWLQGRFEENQPLLIGFGVMYPDLAANNRSSLAANYAEQGNMDAARTEFEAAALNDFGDVPRHLSWQTAVAFLAETCAALRDSKRAPRLYELLTPLNGRNLLLPPSMTVGPASYYLGILAAVMDRREDASGHFQDALHLDAKIGAKHHQARTQLAYADMLISRGAKGDEARARELLESASRTATELGMARVVERAAELMGRIGGIELAAVVHRSTALRGLDARALGESATVLLRREGEYWTIEQQDTVLRLKDVRGLHYLAHLLKHPRREFHALELIGAAPESSGSPGDRRRSGSDQDDPALDLSGLGAVLDDTAKAQYRSRRAALQEELEEAEAHNDLGRLGALRAEIDALNDQLSGAVGLGGKDRNPGSSSERARLTVTKGIKAVVKKIHDGNPSLGRQLATQVRTGHLCCYTPDPDRPIRWIF